MKLIIDVDEKLICEGFERTFTKEERDILIRAIGNGTPYEERPQGKWDVISLLRDYVYVRCSECGQGTRLVRDSKNEFCCIKDIRDKLVACPYCGAYIR